MYLSKICNLMVISAVLAMICFGTCSFNRNGAKKELQDAIDRGDKARVSQLLREHDLLNHTIVGDPPGQTPLMRAVISRQPEIVKLLVEEFGADLNIAGVGGQTALHVAAVNNQPTLVEYLIGKGASVNRQDNAGQTALHISAAAKRHENIAVLLKNGADRSLKDSEGKTFADLLKYEG